MRRIGIFAATVVAGGLAVLPATAGGDANRVAVEDGGRLRIDAARVRNGRGFLLTKFVLPSSRELALLVDPGEVALAVSFDVVSGTGPHGGELLVGVNVEPGTGRAPGAKMLGPLAGTSGAGGLHHWYGGPGGHLIQADDGANARCDAWDTGRNHVGRRVRIEWMRGEAAPEIDSIVLRLDGEEAVRRQADAYAFPAGALGFYVLEDRDLVIDNFRVEAVPVVVDLPVTERWNIFPRGRPPSSR